MQTIELDDKTVELLKQVQKVYELDSIDSTVEKITTELLEGDVWGLVQSDPKILEKVTTEMWEDDRDENIVQSDPKILGFDGRFD